MAALDEKTRGVLSMYNHPCPECGYSLYQLEAANCPECGWEITLAALRRPRKDWENRLEVCRTLLWIVLIVLCVFPAVGTVSLWLTGSQAFQTSFTPGLLATSLGLSLPTIGLLWWCTSTLKQNSFARHGDDAPAVIGVSIVWLIIAPIVGGCTGMLVLFNAAWWP